MNASFRDHLFAGVQRLLPTRVLSTLMFRLTRIRAPWFKNAFIRVFMRAFNISLDNAVLTRPQDFEHFNAFFTRALKDNARPLAGTPDTYVSPVDGTVSQAAAINGDTLIQAKGLGYTVAELIGAEHAETFRDGSFCTIYLAPYNYHRIHMPVDGQLREWRYTPGRLFSVNPATVRALPKLFARNERVTALFDTPHGPMAMVLVGALFVGSIETVWAGRITPPHTRGAGGSYTPHSAVQLVRGAEMGRFNMGSTVVLLHAGRKLHWHADTRAGKTVQMGEALARWTS